MAKSAHRLARYRLAGAIRKSCASDGCAVTPAERLYYHPRWCRPSRRHGGCRGRELVDRARYRSGFNLGATGTTDSRSVGDCVPVRLSSDLRERPLRRDRTQTAARGANVADDHQSQLRSVRGVRAVRAGPASFAIDQRELQRASHQDLLEDPRLPGSSNSSEPPRQAKDHYGPSGLPISRPSLRPTVGTGTIYLSLARLLAVAPLA